MLKNEVGGGAFFFTSLPLYFLPQKGISTAPFRAAICEPSESRTTCLTR
jgi:hypothetical protein